MVPFLPLGRPDLVLVGVLLAVGTSGCARQWSPAVPRDPPVVTSAVVPPAAPVVISSNVSVSDEIATACRLTLARVEDAPKFAFDESALQLQDGDAIEQIARCVTTGPLAGRGLVLVGRADPRGESGYNLALGGRRASSVGEYLTRLGVESSRVIQTSRGELDATGTDEEGWKRDRRVDIELQEAFR